MYQCILPSTEAPACRSLLHTPPFFYLHHFGLPAADKDPKSDAALMSNMHNTLQGQLYNSHLSNAMTAALRSALLCSSQWFLHPQSQLFCFCFSGLQACL